MVAKGITITTTAKRDTKRVRGSLHLPRSTMAGCTDFPETVMYCRFASTTSERNKIKIANTIRKMAIPVASLRPCCPRALYSTILVVTVCTRPGAPIIEGIP